MQKKAEKARSFAASFAVPPGRRVRVKDFATTWIGDGAIGELRKDELRAAASAELRRTVEELSDAQELLYANDIYSVLVVFQAMDAAGKDGTIKHVMSGINPQGCQVFSFKRPSDEELDHTFLWRYMRCLPERGRIGIFNRSYYEEVLVVRVHADILARQKLPEGKRGRKFWQARHEDINNFELHLARNGTLIVKFFLNVSKREQKQRFLARLDRPEKNWKFSAADVDERAHWDDYMDAYGEMLSATSSEWAPWYVVPADEKYVTHAAVARILAERIRELGLQPPRIGAEQKASLDEARRRLLEEKQ